MRIRPITLTAALLASATLAMAQTPAPAAAPAPAANNPWYVDFGARITATTGDEARYERYRDLRDGLASKIVWGQDTEQHLFGAMAENVGYRDQRYSVNYKRSRLKFNFLWDSTPLNYSYETLTPFVESSPGVWTLDLATRSAVQGPTNSTTDGVVGVPCAPGGPPAACSTPVNAGQALASRSVWNNLAKPFDLQQRRDSAGFDVTFAATKDVSVNFAFNSTNKTGHQPWGASFAFNNAVEVPLPLDNRTNDFTSAVEWANQDGMLRLAWDGSFFDNNINSLTWDNPIRATDFTNGLTPPSGPYDPSGYSNGNGPATGRMAVAPDNSMNVISATGLYKMPAHTVLNANLAFTTMKQNDALIPWTTNPNIANAAVFAVFPHLARLPRDTAEAEVRGINALFNFNSRPTKYLGLTMRYRYNDHQNKTPTFDAEEYVRFDAVPEETGGETENFNIKRNTFDLTGTLTVLPYTTLRVGYGYDDFKRTGRAFSDMTDYTGRISIDTLGYQYVTIRAIYEKTKRIGTGFSEDAIEEGGAQPGLRFYDEADRDRDKATVVFVLNPASMLDVNFSVGYGHDTYGGPGHEFGLLDAKTRSYNVGINAYPKDTVSFGMNYGRDTFSSLQESRNANPPQDLTAIPPVLASDYGSWFDPNRTWSLDNDETVNNFNLYLDLIKAMPKTDIRFAYDFSDSDSAFVHGGPRIQELSTNRALSGPEAIVYPINPSTGARFTIPAPCAAGNATCFEALPDVTNQWHRFTLDLKYFLSAKAALGIGWWYEKFDVTDFATIDANGSVGYTAATGTPRIDYLGGLILGYGNRPYKGNTGFIRMIYFF